VQSNTVLEGKAGSGFLGCRICRKVAFATFIAILVVEAIVLIPSYSNYARDWKENKQAEAFAAVSGVFSSVNNTTKMSVDDISTYLDFLVKDNILLGWSLHERGNAERLAQSGSTSVVLAGSDTKYLLVDTPKGQALDVLWYGDILGFSYDLQVRIGLYGLEEALKNFLIRIVGLIAIISVFATMVTMLVLNKEVLRPILNLRLHLSKEGVEAGDAEVLITDDRRDDEIGDMTDAFNDMVVHIGDNIRTIKEHESQLRLARDDLELRVEERTQALHQEVQERKDIEKKLREKERTLYQSANFDELTRLPNRLLGSDRLLKALDQAKRNERVGALMFIDLDNFKEINDAMGHAMGDELLVQTAKRLSLALRGMDTIAYLPDPVTETISSDRGDIVARIGGDEFMVILPEIASEDDATVVAQRLSDACAAPFQLNNHEVFVTASIGIAVFPRDGADQQELMMSADTALYAVKDAGRNGYRFFSAEMNHRLIERMEIEAQLRHALDENEFRICYQPVVDVKTKKMVGVEALLRWNNVHLGEVSPDEFIHVAEGTGLIIPIGEWVLNEAFQVAKRLDDMGFPMRMALNVSLRQFRGAHFVESVIKVLDLVKLPADRLELEITESLLVDEQSEAVNIINELRDLGVRLSIDDFGTGYSALSYLRRFDVNTLKIDRSFISGIEHSEQDASLTRTIIAMAKNFGLEIIAEGVEDTTQLAFLVEHKCDFAQGYYFGKPMPVEELIGMLQSSKVG